VLLFALALALGIYYSVGVGWAASLLVVATVFIPSLLLGLVFYPWLLTAFLAFAFVVSFCSFLASFWSEISISKAWAVLSAGMLLLVILAFLVVFYKVAENKDMHVNLFVDSLVAQAGSTASVPISAQTISTAVSKEDFASFITQDAVRELLVSNYPGFVSLTEAQKTALVQAFHLKAVDLAKTSLNSYPAGPKR